MTEAEWLACSDPWPMLDFVRDQGSPRKLRLFACACCRYVWHLLGDVRSRKAVEIGERMADGRWKGSPFYPPSWRAYCEGGRLAAQLAAHGTTYTAAADAADTVLRTGIARSDLLQDLFGNPFRRAEVDPSWLVWKGGTVPQLAQMIYDELTFDCLPFLADALEEAGCANAELLAHCRRPAEHGRGCWVLDILLGKE